MAQLGARFAPYARRISFFFPFLVGPIMETKTSLSGKNPIFSFYSPSPLPQVLIPQKLHQKIRIGDALVGTCLHGSDKRMRFPIISFSALHCQCPSINVSIIMSHSKQKEKTNIISIPTLYFIFLFF